MASRTRPRHAASPAAAIRQAVYASDPAQLMQMPAHWLEEAEDLQRLLQRLGAEKSAAYLATNLPILGAVGAGYTNQDRDAVLSTILRMGLANAVRDLAELGGSQTPYGART